MICKDCDRPLTTYQGFDPFKAEEVFCAYCEAHPPVYKIDGAPTNYKELDPNEYTDFGVSKDKLGTTIIGPYNVLVSEPVGEKFYYVDHTGKSPEPSDNFAGRVADMIFNNANAPWRGTSPVYLSLHVGEPERGNEIGDLIYPGHRQWYSRQPTTFSDARDGACVNERLATWKPDNGWRITHFGVYDAKTGGNLLFHSPLDREIELDEGDTFEFQPGSVTLNLT